MAPKKSSDLILIGEAKRWLRRALIRERQSISPKNRKKWSRAALNHLFRSSYYKRAKTIAAFLSFGSEIDTNGLIQRAWRDRKKVLIPITSRGFHRSFFAVFQKGDPLRKMPHGPFELHRNNRPFPFGSIDLVIVPGLAYDRYHYRLGYGGGVYDRMLKKAKRAKHLGLFFSNQYLPVLPRGGHDRKMDAIVTENGI